MIFSKNRYPLFRIMLTQIGPAASAGKSGSSLIRAESLFWLAAYVIEPPNPHPDRFETGAGAPKDQP
jgi:hypothetical protein